MKQNMVYGGPDVNERMRVWSELQRLQRVDTWVCRDACVLFSRRRRRNECYEGVPDHYETLDHANVWRREDGSRFILAHVYAHDVPLAARTWALEQGLRLISDPLDDWYGYGTVPLRYYPIDPSSPRPTSDRRER